MVTLIVFAVGLCVGVACGTTYMMHVVMSKPCRFCRPGTPRKESKDAQSRR